MSASLPPSDAGPQVVVGEHGGVAGSQAQAGLAFPVGGEAAHLAQLGGADVVDDQGEDAAGGGGGELLVVADQQQFGAVAVAQSGEVVDDLAGRHGRLVEDDQRPRFDAHRCCQAGRCRCRGVLWQCS